MTEREQLQFIRSIKGPPATILILLMVRGASMTNLDICRWTGYSDKPVTTALITLQQLGLAQDNGRAHGWSLAAGINQLPLPFTELSASAPTRGASDPGRNKPGSSQLSTGNPPEIGIIPISGPRDRNYSDLPSRASAAAADLNSSPDPEISDQQQQQHRPRDRNNSDLRRLVEYLRIRQPGRSTVLAAEPSAALAWWWLSLIDPGGLDNPVGWFIRRIQNADPPPDDLDSVGRAWLKVPRPARRRLPDLTIEETAAFWFDAGIGPSNAELALKIENAGGFNYAEW